MVDARSRLALIEMAQRAAARLPERWDRGAREIGKLALNYRGARRAGRRSLLFAVARRSSPAVVAPFGSGRLLVDSGDEVIGRGVFVTGGFERLYMEKALDVLRTRGLPSGDGTTFVDVGANIGTSTVDALLHFGFGRAVCIEPDPYNCRILRANLTLNDLDDRATTHCLALSSEDGHARLERSPRNFGDHRIVGPPSSAADGSEDRETVECARFDSLVDRGDIDLDTLGMVWIDAQGHETFVLEGAPTLLETNVPVVVEYWPMALGATLPRFEELVAGAYRSVVDLRRLAAGVTAGAVLDAGDIGRLHSRYPGRLLTDLLLLK